MNWSLVIIVVLSPCALFCLLVGVFGISSGLKMPDGKKQDIRLLGGVVYLLLSIVFTALTLGVIFK